MFYQRSLVYRILDSFFRHRIIFLVATLTVIALIVGFLVLRPKTYTAGYTVIQDDRTLTNPLADQQQDTSTNDLDTAVSHFTSLIATQDFISQALTNPDGTPVALHYPVDVNNNDSLVALRKDITVTESAADAFTVDIEYRDPDDAKAILAGLISTFISRSAQEKSAYFSSDVSFIQSQVDEYRQKLSAAEDALTNFKSQNANNLPSNQDAMEQNVVQYQSQAQDLQTQQIADQQREQYLQTQLAQIPQTIVSQQNATDSPLVAQLKQLETQHDLDIAVKEMKPTHPEVLALNQQIGRLQALIAAKVKNGDAQGQALTDTEPNPLYQSLQGQLVQVEIDQRANQAKEASTMQLLNQATKGVSLIPGAERTLTNLERDYTTNSAAYDNLMQRLQEAQINEQLNLRQAQNAYTVLLTSPPVSSQGPSKILALFVGGVLLALLIGSSLVLLCEYLDRSLRDPLDAQRILDLPVLAVLPDTPLLRAGEHGDRYLPGSTTESLSGSNKALSSS